MLDTLVVLFRNGERHSLVGEREEVIFREVPTPFDVLDWDFSLVARTDYVAIGTTFDLEYVDPQNPKKFGSVII